MDASWEYILKLKHEMQEQCTECKMSTGVITHTIIWVLLWALRAYYHRSKINEINSHNVEVFFFVFS
ncbi:hypothetical protein YC2023_040274 [Brassica napus]